MLYGEKLKEICEKLGIKREEIPDGLYSTLLNTIAEKAGSGGGSGDVVIVDELPTENIDESKIYLVNSDIEVYWFIDGGFMTLRELLSASLGEGAEPLIYYEVVNELPASPNETNLITFNPVYGYIYNGIAYFYTDAGAGNMWLTAGTLMTYLGAPTEDKGRTYDITEETEDGFYTYYTDKSVGVAGSEKLYRWNGASWEEIGQESENLLVSLAEGTLTEITAEDLQGCTSIGSYAFYSCGKLKAFGFPKTVTSFHKNAFAPMSEMENVYYEGSLEDWLNISFDELSSKPMYNTSVGASDLLGANLYLNGVLLKELVLPTTPVLKQYAFACCRSLTSIEIPNSVTSIPKYAFACCSSLTSIKIPNSVTSIGDCAFQQSYSLTSIELPDSVTFIGNSTFSQCYKLNRVIFGANITTISPYAFTRCSEVSLYDFRKATAVPTLSNKSAFNSIPSTCKIVVPDALYDSWIAATNWSTYASQIVKASEYTEA